MSDEEHRLEIEAPPEQTLGAVAAAAKDWGAEWVPEPGGGQLYLPVVAGLRRGLLSGRLTASPSAAGGTRLTLRGETTHWRVHRSAAAVLMLGLLGAVPVLLWPLSPDFLALAPVGLVLLFLAWFMVISRLRSAGGAEFLEAVRDRLPGEGQG